MRYEHTPRPDVEGHYHIRELIERQDARSQDRSRWQEREKSRYDREATVRAAKPRELVPFWCPDCERDFQAECLLEEEEDWNADGVNAFYRTKCFCGRRLVRLVTDKARDPYWHLSRGVRADRRNHAWDIIQPFEEGFNMLYGKPKNT